MEKTRRLLDETLSPLYASDSPGAAVLVVQNGAERLRFTTGLANTDTHTPITVHTAFDAGSIAKTITGFCVAMLEDDHKLSLDANIREFLPELPDAASRISIAHLLRHESGLHDYSTLLYFMAGWHPHAPPTSELILEILSRVPGPKWPPGSRYHYADTNYFLLARAIERIVDMPFGQFAEHAVFKLLGMNDSFMTDTALPGVGEVAEGYAAYPIGLGSPHMTHAASRPGHYPVGLRYRHTGAEGFRTSVADLAALGREILAPSRIKAATMARITAPVRLREGALGYGYGLNVGTYLGLEFFGHNGMIQGFTASLSVFPDHNLVIAGLTNREDVSAWSYRNFALKELFGVEPSTASESVRIGGSSPKPRPGFYLDPMTSSFLVLTVDNETLCAGLNGGVPQPVNYETRCSVGEEDDARITVRRDEQTHQFVPFIDALRTPPLQAYTGNYVRKPLQTTFCVAATNAGIQLTNTDPARPSMDLTYTPTIQDFFWSHDPYPGISQIEFLRDGGRIATFRYRDYDGDGREAFVFRRV